MVYGVSDGLLALGRRGFAAGHRLNVEIRCFLWYFRRAGAIPLRFRLRCPPLLIFR